MLKLLVKFALIMVICLISACGQDYQAPYLAMPFNYKEAPKGWKFAEPRDTENKGAWWTVFKDPYLDSLEQKINISNQNVAQFVAQYQQALATIEATRASYWPTLSATASGIRSKQSANTNTTNKTSGSSIPINDFLLEPSLSWTPDLFGIIGQAVDADEAAAQASAAALANTQLSIQSMLAQTYFQLRSLDLVQKFLDDTVRAYSKSLKLVQNKYTAGVASRLDITQAETQLQSTITQALDNGILRAQYEHAIAVMIGEPPENFFIARNNTTFINPSIPIGVPSVLLERRPDIAQAERLMAQANAQIGLQIAAYFPVLTLTGADGFSSTKYKNLISHSSNLWSIGAALAETIFDGGARSAKIKGAQANYEQTVAFYKQTVLSALQDVEDNLVALRILDKEVKVQKLAVASATQGLQITMNQYNSGTAAYSDVITAQTTAYAAKQTAAAITSRRMVAAVKLIQALGGGWENSL